MFSPNQACVTNSMRAKNTAKPKEPTKKASPTTTISDTSHLPAPTWLCGMRVLILVREYEEPTSASGCGTVGSSKCSRRYLRKDYRLNTPRSLFVGDDDGSGESLSQNPSTSPCPPSRAPNPL